MLCKRMDFAKLDYQALPASGLGRTFLTKLGHGKSTADEHKQRAKALPAWLNKLMLDCDAMDPSSHPAAGRNPPFSNR